MLFVLLAYAVVAHAMIPEQIAIGDCGSCMAAAAPGQLITHDADCMLEGGPGCVEISTPGEMAVYNGCRHCGMPPFESVACVTSTCEGGQVQGLFEDLSFLIEETCESCQTKAVFDPDMGVMETLTYDMSCLGNHAGDIHGGLGCISISSPNDPNPIFSGCRYCGFSQYGPVSCETATCALPPPSGTALVTEDCDTCAQKAGVGERVTYDEECFVEGGLGCVSVAPPDVPSQYSGCRHCEYGVFAQISCSTCLQALAGDFDTPTQSLFDTAMDTDIGDFEVPEQFQPPPQLDQQQIPTVQASPPPQIDQQQPAFQQSPPPQVDQQQPVIQQSPPSQIDQQEPAIQQQAPPQVDQQQPTFQQPPPPQIDQQQIQQQAPPQADQQQPAFQQPPPPQIDQQQIQQQAPPQVNQQQPAFQQPPPPQIDQQQIQQQAPPQVDQQQPAFQQPPPPQIDQQQIQQPISQQQQLQQPISQQQQLQQPISQQQQLSIQQPPPQINQQQQPAIQQPPPQINEQQQPAIQQPPPSQVNQQTQPAIQQPPPQLSEQQQPAVQAPPTPPVFTNPQAVQPETPATGALEDPAFPPTPDFQQS